MCVYVLCVSHGNKEQLYIIPLILFPPFRPQKSIFLSSTSTFFSSVRCVFLRLKERTPTDRPGWLETAVKGRFMRQKQCERVMRQRERERKRGRNVIPIYVRTWYDFMRFPWNGMCVFAYVCLLCTGVHALYKIFCVSAYYTIVLIFCFCLRILCVSALCICQYTWRLCMYGPHTYAYVNLCVYMCMTRPTFVHVLFVHVCICVSKTRIIDISLFNKWWWKRQYAPCFPYLPKANPSSLERLSSGFRQNRTHAHNGFHRALSSTFFHLTHSLSFSCLRHSLISLAFLTRLFTWDLEEGGGGKMEGTFRQFHLDAVVLPSLASSVSSTSLPKMLKVIFLLHDSSLPFLLRPKFKKHSTPSIFLILLRRKILTNKIWNIKKTIWKRKTSRRRRERKWIIQGKCLDIDGTRNPLRPLPFANRVTDHTTKRMRWWGRRVLDLRLLGIPKIFKFWIQIDFHYTIGM